MAVLTQTEAYYATGHSHRGLFRDLNRASRIHRLSWARRSNTFAYAQRPSNGRRPLPHVAGRRVSLMYATTSVVDAVDITEARCRQLMKSSQAFASYFASVVSGRARVHR